MSADRVIGIDQNTPCIIYNSETIIGRALWPKDIDLTIVIN